MDANDKGGLFEPHYHPYLQTLDKITPSAPKQTNLNAKSPLDNPKKMWTRFINMIVRLLDSPPLVTICKFKSKDTLLQFSTMSPWIEI
jgi:hypothetical protein